MKVKNKVQYGNSGRATPSLRYHQKKPKEIELNNNKGYFWNVCQNNLPEDFPNSK
jgi:hypothetical protein